MATRNTSAVQVSSIVHQVNDDENAAAELAASKYVDELNQKAATNKEYGEAVHNIINAGHTKSAKIRALLALNLKRGEVAKLLGIRYQHVRNVELMPIKKAA